MWSTVTLTLFFEPQSLAKLSNHLSYSGTKWLHCTMVSVLACAMALETNGAEIAGAEPAAASVRPAFFKKRRLVTDKSLFVLILVSSPGVFPVRGGSGRLASSTGLLF